MQVKLVVYVLMLNFALSGCTTVTSKHTDDLSFSSKAKGITYFLPTKQLKFTASRKVLDPKAIAEALEKNKKALSEAKTTSTSVTANAARLEAIFNAADPKAKADAEKNMYLAKAEQTVADSQVSKLEKVVAELEQQLLAVKLRAGECAFEYSAKLELMPAQADTSYRFIANLSHSPLRDDTLNLSVSSSGLLTSANVVAIDRTGDIAVEIAGAIGGFGDLGGARVMAMAGIQPATVPKCDELPKEFMSIFDADTVEGVNSQLKTASFPFQLLTKYSVAPPADSTGSTMDAIDGALFYRTPAPVTMTVYQCNSNVLKCDIPNATPVQAAIVMLPQFGPISYIPMKSSAFVKTVNDVKFEDGVITNWSADRPSEVLEVVRLPVEILKAIISIPAEILSIKIDTSDKQKGLAESQQAQIQAAEQLEKLKLCIQTQEKAEKDATECFAE